MPQKLPPRIIVRKRLLEIQELAKALHATAAAALREIASAEKVRVQKWRCARCGHIRWFTKPVEEEACDACEKCECPKFVPDGEEPLAD